jgi:hypothetical protein
MENELGYIQPTDPTMIQGFNLRKELSQQSATLAKEELFA